MTLQRLRFALTLNLVLAVALLAACTSCASWVSTTRSTSQQYNAGVKIDVTCHDHVHRGSGVIVGPGHVLTAKHVVECALVPGFPFTVPPVKVTVDPGDGAVEAEVELTLGEGTKDIARLVLAKPTLGAYMSPITIGPAPAIGETVCEASMVPRPTYRCGIVQQSNGYINMEMRVEHGNSGSGLYNSKGQLIGIVVQLWLCEANEFCGGRAAPLQAARYLIP